MITVREYTATTQSRETYSEGGVATFRVPPSLVALAVRKIYPHRLVLATVENERSLMWGSDPAAIRELLEGVTIQDVIEEVLASVEAPL